MTRSAALVLGAALLLVVNATWGVRLSTARFVDASTSSGSLTTETLDPPTGLSASVAGSTVTLNWTPSADAARAAGYAVLRGTASGGPYTQVATVTPATTATTTDAPGDGTFRYLLRTTTAGTWTSVDSNEATAVVSSAISTGMKDCASQAADTGGDGNGYEGTPAGACADGGDEASDVNSGSGSSTSCTSTQKDRHRFWGYAFGLPGSVSSIADIAVRLDLRVDSTGGSVNQVCVELSWNGGTSWTAPRTMEVTSTTETTYTLAGTWGRTWSPADLSSADFRVRITNVSNNQNRDFYLDDVGVDVSYVP